MPPPQQFDPAPRFFRKQDVGHAEPRTSDAATGVPDDLEVAGHLNALGMHAEHYPSILSPSITARSSLMEGDLRHILLCRRSLPLLTRCLPNASRSGLVGTTPKIERRHNVRSHAACRIDSRVHNNGVARGVGAQEGHQPQPKGEVEDPHCKCADRFAATSQSQCRNDAERNVLAPREPSRFSPTTIGVVHPMITLLPIARQAIDPI